MDVKALDPHFDQTEDHPRDAVLRNVLVDQPGERFVGHIALAHQAARAIEAVEVAAGGDFYLREHKRPSFQARHESYPVACSHLA